MLMSTLSIRNLPKDVHRELRLRAARNGRSMEAEARAILSEACRPRRPIGEVVAELIEIATVPSIVCSPEDDVRHGLKQLGDFIAGIPLDKDF